MTNPTVSISVETSKQLNAAEIQGLRLVDSQVANLQRQLQVALKQQAEVYQSLGLNPTTKYKLVGNEVSELVDGS